ncbi:DUF2087 domain-containing protein [Streptomyces sp. NBC_01218]|uniref:DUF2087 domain-containing protein n=1 Tax=unclassified Streptomyces TaxID=2593676 RepID=UPI002E0D43F1|nr:DUF2087 domain-containing protein [Streptomyces sp. NBC_01218]
MPDDVTLTAPHLSDLFSRGRLKAVPRRPARRGPLLEHLAATLFDTGRSYTEGEVNDALLTVHDDSAALRRYLVESRLLTRTRDGRAYRRAAEVPSA